MSNWITGKELMVYWDIEGFELFNCLGKGLQPYTAHGKKIVNTDPLEHERRVSYEHLEADLRHWNDHPGLGSGRKLSERELKQRAEEQFESQSKIPKTPPRHPMSFTLPDNDIKAGKAILKVMWLKFRKDEASEFAKQYGYRVLNEQRNGKASELRQSTLEPSSMKYKTWLPGEEIKSALCVDDAGLLHLIKKGVLLPHTESLEPLTVEDINYMMSDSEGYCSPAWPMAGFDGFRFHKDEFLRFSESQGISMGVDKDEDVHQISSNRADSEVNEKASIPEEEGPLKSAVAPATILLQLEPDDQVKIKIPGGDTEIKHITTDFKFRSAATGAAKAFKEILENGQYLSVDDKTRDHIKQAEMKLQEHFKTKEKFIVLSEKRSGRYVPVFKIKAQIQKEALERDLERLKELGDIDQVRDEITAAYEKKIINDEDVISYYKKYRGVSAQSIYDESDLAKNPSDKGSSHLL